VHLAVADGVQVVQCTSSARGPDVHGITRGAFLHVFEAGGNRIELFGTSGILELVPDFETVTWDLADFDIGPGRRSRPRGRDGPGRGRGLDRTDPGRAWCAP